MKAPHPAEGFITLLSKEVLKTNSKFHGFQLVFLVELFFIFTNFKDQQTSLLHEKRLSSIYFAMLMPYFRL